MFISIYLFFEVITFYCCLLEYFKCYENIVKQVDENKFSISISISIHLCRHDVVMAIRVGKDT